MKTDADKVAENNSRLLFVPPRIPANITDPADQVTFLIEHYWDGFNFGDTLCLHHPEIMEPVIANYLALLQQAGKAVIGPSLKEILDKLQENNDVYSYLSGKFNDLLYDAASPVRDDEIYIEYLKYIIDNPRTDDANRQRAIFRMENASKNRIDSLATDFEYTLSNGRKSTLYSIDCPYTLIFFYYPDCSKCKQYIEQVKISAIINNWLSNKLLIILAFYPDNKISLWRQYSGIIPPEWINGYDRNTVIESKRLYDIKASPTIYLLDKNKRVILKDAGLDKIEAYLYENMPVILDK